MTTEAAILRAYALLTQGRHDEAERMLKADPGALNTPSGADLFARIRYEQGLENEARQIWDRIHMAAPDFEPASKALAAFSEPSQEALDDNDDDEEETRKFPICAFLFLLVGVALSAWGLLRKPQPIVQSREIIRTNTVERIVNVPVTSFVTSVVERVSVVTNIMPVIRREVVTNVVERILTNETVKVVVKEVPVAVEKRDVPHNTGTNVLSSAGARHSEPMLNVESRSDTTADAIKMPQVSRQQRRSPIDRDSWLDRAILGLYRRLGLMPEFKSPLLIDTEK